MEAWGAPLAWPAFSATPPGPSARVAATSSGERKPWGLHSPPPSSSKTGQEGRESRTGPCLRHVPVRGVPYPEGPLANNPQAKLRPTAPVAKTTTASAQPRKESWSSRGRGSPSDPGRGRGAPIHRGSLSWESGDGLWSPSPFPHKGSPAPRLGLH